MTSRRFSALVPVEKSSSRWREWQEAREQSARSRTARKQQQPAATAAEPAAAELAAVAAGDCMGDYHGDYFFLVCVVLPASPSTTSVRFEIRAWVRAPCERASSL